ncbi:MAG: class I SAM-dependent methyltransferase [Bacteroidales bacterium]|jgi:ubiquinone/menaquinone biosynthesis C-methylase UbiE|nr:class I SAM-dependent methyltransferase [Bacteroidales bacterium]
MTIYHPEPYWSDVANRIKARKGKNIIAGDDEPFYRYKRKKFLSMLNSVDFKANKVLELGCGPGGNLQEVWKKLPLRLVGTDISVDMIELSKDKLPKEIELIKIDGISLPFKEKEFDYVFTATVLQHNTDEEMLKKIMSELCRVASNKVFLFERIEKNIKGDELCYGRPISYYEQICKLHGFNLISKSFINIRISYYVSGIIRKVFSPNTRKEGEPLSKIATFLQKITLPITKHLDKIFKSNNDIAKLEFNRLVINH